MKTKMKALLMALAFALGLVVSSYATTTFVMSTAQCNLCVIPIATNCSGALFSIYAGADPGVGTSPGADTLLIQWTLPSMTSGNCSAGVLTIPTVTNVNASAGGTAGWWRLGPTATGIIDGTVGNALTLNTTTIVSGGPCSLSGTITVPQGT